MQQSIWEKKKESRPDGPKQLGSQDWESAACVPGWTNRRKQKCNYGSGVFISSLLSLFSPGPNTNKWPPSVKTPDKQINIHVPQMSM